MNLPLNDQVALVTGASRGIGREIALALAAQGCHLALNFHRDAAAAQEVAEAIKAMGRQACAIKADVGCQDQSAEMVDRAVETFGRIDILVNNAGITRDGLLVGMPAEDIEAVVRTNLLGVIYPTQAVAACMLRARKGRIVNLSSTAAGKPGRGQSSYAAAKGAVEAFTRAMAVELAPRNILVNAIAPGVVATEMTEDIRQHGEEEIMSRLLIKRCAQAKEVADLVLYLVGPQNLYMTGEVLRLDGGLKMG